MGPIIDADTHIAESEQMWALLDKEVFPRRPVLTRVPEDTIYGGSNAFWLIDGTIFPKPAGKGGNRLITPSAAKQQASRTDIPVESRELTDPALRLKAMDRLNVQTQVVYPTLFLVYLTDDVELEIALCKAYNRFLSEACSKVGDRLRWVAVLPLRAIEASLEEMNWAKEHGAVGLFFRGLEKDLNLDDPYFFPIYQAAMDRDLAICIHTGAGAPVMSSLFHVERHAVFAHGRLLPLIAFRNLVANRIPERFPGLRFGFIEASAGWIPFLLHALRRQVRGRWEELSSPDLFEKYRFFVACEADEDVSYIARYVGEDHLIIGSDYGHNDPSEEVEFVRAIQSREDISPDLAGKILSENPRRLYGI